MPSTLLGSFSGGQPLVSGNVYSGKSIPYTGVRLYNDPSSSGNVFIGFSGGVTIQSGGALSSGGLMDGMVLPPGQTWSVQIPAGGLPNIYLAVPTTGSGFTRVYWQPYGSV